MGPGFESRPTDPRAFVAHHWASCLPVWVDGSLLWKVPKVLMLPECFSGWGWGGGNRILKGLPPQLIVGHMGHELAVQT